MRIFLRLLFLSILIIFLNNCTSNNEFTIFFNRHKAYLLANNLSTSPNPFVYYILNDDNGNTVTIVDTATYMSLPFINWKNKYQTKIHVKDISTYYEYINYITVDYNKLKESEFYGLSRSELIETYFNERGNLKHARNDEGIEFIYYVLSKGIYIYHGCESGDDLWIK